MSSASENSLTITIELLNSISADILSKVEGVQRVETISDKEYLISSTFDNRADIFDKIAGSGNKLLGMTKEKNSLEEVFKNVTQDKK